MTSTATSSTGTGGTITHAGIEGVTINQDTVNRAMEQVEALENVRGNINQGNAHEAANASIVAISLLTRMVVRICVNLSARMENFEQAIDNRMQLLTNKASDAYEAAKLGYQTLSGKWKETHKSSRSSWPMRNCNFQVCNRR